jgi:hypothetical protein
MMKPTSEPDLTPPISALAILAVAFSGFGGLASDDTHRQLLAAGAGFCLLMLGVVWIFLTTKADSHQAQSGLSAAFGALVGVCHGLYFATGPSLRALLLKAAIGALGGYIAYWVLVLRTGGLWRDR